MNKNKLVTIVGHSLVPRSIGAVHGAHIKIFRSPGARISNFHDNPILNDLLNYPHDLTILFIGGNDINDNCSPWKIADDIQKIVHEIHNNCNSHIALILIEHRNPPPGNKFNVTSSIYNKVASSINNKLKKKLKCYPYVQFISIGAKPFKSGTTDGVHFDLESISHLKSKIRNTIKHFIARKE